MSTLSRIMLYMVRKPFGNIVTVLLLFVLYSGVLICLAIRESAAAANDEFLAAMASSYKIEIDKTQADPSLFEVTVLEDGSSYTTYLGGKVDDDMVEILLSGAQYSDYNLTYEWSLVYRGIMLVPAWLTEDAKAGDESAKRSLMRTKVIGTRKSEYHEMFLSGVCELIEGRHIEPDDIGKVIISADLAEHNQLSIGDSFTIEDNELLEYIGSDFIDKTIGVPLPLEIVGFFKIYDGYDPEWYLTEGFRLENFLYVDIQTQKTIYTDFQKYRGYNNMMYYDDITFFVDDPVKLSGAVEKLKDLDIEWHYFAVTKGSPHYEASAAPLHSIRTALAVLMALLILGCGIIFFLTFKSRLQSRRREIGILLSAGITPLGIISQLTVELLILFALASCLTALIAPAIAQWFGDMALTASLTMSRTGPTRLIFDFATGKFVVEAAASPPEKLIVSINPELMWLVGIATVGIASLFTLLTAMSIVRMKPIDALTESR